MSLSPRPGDTPVSPSPGDGPVWIVRQGDVVR